MRSHSSNPDKGTSSIEEVTKDRYLGRFRYRDSLLGSERSHQGYIHLYIVSRSKTQPYRSDFVAHFQWRHPWDRAQSILYKGCFPPFLSDLSEFISFLASLVNIVPAPTCAMCLPGRTTIRILSFLIRIFWSGISASLIRIAEVLRKWCGSLDLDRVQAFPFSKVILHILSASLMGYLHWEGMI